MELEKFIFRRQPLGSDRFNRRYWWGLGGVRGAVIAEHMPAAGPPTVSIITDHVRPRASSITPIVDGTGMTVALRASHIFAWRRGDPRAGAFQLARDDQGYP